MKPIPGTTPPVYEPIPPAMFVRGQSVPNQSSRRLDDFSNLSSSIQQQPAGCGLGGTLHGKTNLYDTTKQTLITYSMAHDDMFPNAGQPNGGDRWRLLLPSSGATPQTARPIKSRSDGPPRPMTALARPAHRFLFPRPPTARWPAARSMPSRMSPSAAQISGWQRLSVPLVQRRRFRQHQSAKRRCGAGV